MKPIETYEHECGLVRVQAVAQGDAALDGVDAALRVADRHLERIRVGFLPLSPAVAREIEDSIDRARDLIGVGQARWSGYPLTWGDEG